METRNITLPNGNQLQLEVSPEYLKLVRQFFNLSEVDEVDDNHLRQFLFSTTKSAIDKAESNL
tara:strand:+ start:1143 stop:1331 length:189 start_codon:yes stop_codon:yes gene_type:complete